jgi:hypothetical protein
VKMESSYVKDQTNYYFVVIELKTYSHMSSHSTF